MDSERKVDGLGSRGYRAPRVNVSVSLRQANAKVVFTAPSRHYEKGSVQA